MGVLPPEEEVPVFFHRWFGARRDHREEAYVGDLFPDRARVVVCERLDVCEAVLFLRDFNAAVEHESAVKRAVVAIDMQNGMQSENLTTEERRQRTYGYWIASINRFNGHIEETPRSSSDSNS